MDLVSAGAVSSISITASWQQLTPLVLFPGIGMLLVGLAFVVYAWRRRLGLRYVAWGAVAWVIAVVLKFAWAINLNSTVYRFLISGLPSPAGSLVFDVYVGLLTGIFEVALVWSVLSRIRLGKAAWAQALAFGIGFGAVEAVLIGASSFASALTVLLAPAQVPASALSQFALANNPLYGAAPIVERVATIFVHMFSAGLIFYAIAADEQRWVWLAIAYKTGLDTIAAFAQFWGVNSVARVWAIEALIIGFGVIGWWGTQWLSARYPDPRPTQPLETEPSPLS